MFEVIGKLLNHKHETYEMVDALLVEAKHVAEEKFDAWVDEKRAQLRVMAGE